MQSSFRSVVPFLAACAGLLACSDARASSRELAGDGESAAESGAPSPRELVIKAGEYAFLAPDTVPAGLTRVRLTNIGKEMHHLQVSRLDDGRTLKDVLDAIAARAVSVPWLTPVGGPSVVTPGRERDVVVDLAPGNYVLLCFMPENHLGKGMARSLVVTPPAQSTRAEPHFDARMVLNDFTFTTTPSLRAGRRTLRVENGAAQWHEVFIARLAPGAKPDDVFAWLRAPEGPPPFEPAGGAMALGRGQVNYMTVDLSPGEYALLCFVPDVKDHKAHVEHGMVGAFTIP